ncbi:hypothetical protein FYJ38_24065 [Clostridium sp. WB02_MRS01]|uniref:hypothetical protein n=1 Tax=Clostridium sp. WB02_MRS01 TaxID=2605777 RepID=UPI0012B2B0A0|nr:hypothetical protein [Clostridium sp. WB02_MRS01]MSS11687.1 hypothetical protein [Clostridium sp. WB02_MRS01]
MPPYGINYTQCVVIVHGKSELSMVQYIKSNLHLPIKIYAKSNGGKGGNSIQIDGLLGVLNSGNFKTLPKFINEYSVEYDKKSKALKNFKLFIIMDTDDCGNVSIENYINGKMFDSHWLKPYIIPIFNITNIEDVMMKAGIMVKRISDSEKGRFYPKIFPINQKPLSFDTIKEVKTLRDSLTKIKETNLCDFIDFCLGKIGIGS